MLATVRENLKGTLMVIVVIIFIVPMVISGVGTTFLGSVAGNDAASVNGEAVTNIELDRAIRLRRNQIMAQQGANASTDQLTDEFLRQPVLEQLTRRLAVVNAGESSGMGLSDGQFTEAVLEQEAFFTDGKFDQQKYNTLLAQNGLTSAGFRNEVKSDVILRQQALGLHLSSFATNSQIEQLVKLTHQRRSFFSTKIPLSLVEEKINVTDDSLRSYYDENQTEFEVPEKLKVDYLELSVAQLAETIEVSDAEILQQYEAEIANFNNDASYEVAHILLEGDSSAKVEELSAKIAAGEDFDSLAKIYSDDIASSEEGGSLGILTPGMFPEAFEEAVYTLEQGQISEPVETDAGTHFIKVTNKIENEIPSLESRKADISSEIAKARATDDFASLVDTLGELTYFSDDLSEASEQMGLAIQQSSFFDKNSGSGIADNAKVRDAAFDEKVTTLGNNSNTIELDAETVVVLRLADRKEAYVKRFDEVIPFVEKRVKEQQVQDLLALLGDEYRAKVEAGDNAKTLAEELGYEYEEYKSVKRSDFEVDPQALGLAFDTELTNASYSFNTRPSHAGDLQIVGVSEFTEGSLSDLEEIELAGFETQISQELASFYAETYESSVVESSKIDIY